MGTPTPSTCNSGGYSLDGSCKEPSKEYPQEVRSHLKPLKALLRARKNQDAVCLVTLIFLAKKLARAGKPCLVTLLPGGVAWSVTLTSALGLHKAKGWAPGSVAVGKPTWEQTGKQGKSRVRFFQGVPDLVRGGGSGGPWPGPSRRSPSRGAGPRASLRSPWADRRERANGLAGLARSPRRGQVSTNQSPTRPSGSREARARVSRTCPIGDNAFWGTTLAGAKTFRPTLRLTIPHRQDLVPGLGNFFKQDPPARRANSHPWTARDTGSLPGRQRAGRQVEASLDGGPRAPGRQAPRTPGGSGCVPLPWGPTSRPPSGRSGAK